MSKAALHFDTVDVFTTERYAGNQLAIVHVPFGRSLEQAQKQKIAIEFGYSETVFLHEPMSTGCADWKIDIFTITGEIPLAGHPVVGTSWLLGRQSGGKLGAGTLVPKAGPTHFTLDWGKGGLCEPTVKTAAPRPESLLIQGREKLDSKECLEKVATTPLNPRVQLDEEWQPSLVGCYFYYVSKATGGEQEIHCRMIEGEIGEDPATGSAACTLTGYLTREKAQNQGTSESGQKIFRYQITQGETMGRKSVIHTIVSVNDSGDIALKGSAVHVMSGTLNEK